uniref:Thioredoxin domain-containing protein n=1 Tax=Kalanchoe fedtschenkoi TaxID=63787 RepID=A0A7N0U6V2_KALFE
MSLNLSAAPPVSRSLPSSSSPCCFARPAALPSGQLFRSWRDDRLSAGMLRVRRRTVSGCVRSSLETAAVVGKVTEVDKDSFWPIVEAAGDKLVVLDMYTQWCGPCKVMAPRFQELSEKYLDVVFLKLDCNQDNKPLAKELGIRVVPTFKILKDSKVVKEVTGAKFDELVFAIDSVRSN